MAVIRRLQEFVAGERGPLASTVGLVLAVAAPTAVRLALQPALGDTLWFATYYPAVVFVTVALGWSWGLAALLLSALSADYFFIPPPEILSLEKKGAAAVAVFLFSGGLLVLTAHLLRQAIQRLNHAAETQKALNRELQHRVNNNLAIVQALAAQTVRSHPDPQAFYEAFRGRLIALSAAQRVLSAGDWETCEFPALPETALMAFATDHRIRMEGPDCSVPANSCVPLVLALHELATNATKYGALSAAEGKVALRWRLREAANGEELVLEWSERGGPAVEGPSRKGLGSRLLIPQPGIKDVQTEYRREGVCCTLIVKGAKGERPTAAKVQRAVVLASSTP